MNKRILSLLLVLCTILVSVPVFALSTTAAVAGTDGKTKVYEYTTSYADHIPTFVDPAATNGALNTTGNWSVGIKWGVTDSSNLNAFNWTSSAGNYNGLATRFQGTANSNRVGGFLNVSRGTGADNYHGAIGSVGSSKGYNTTIRYTAEKAGVVDIIFDKLGNWARGVGGTYTYHIVVDGAIVWSWSATKTATDGTLSDGNTIYDPIAWDGKIALTDVVVEAGSHIDFVCENTLTNVNETWTTGGNEMFPTIAYSIADATVFTTSFNDTTNLPVQNADGTVATFGNWTPMSYPRNNPLAGLAMDKKNSNLTTNGISATSDGDGGGTPAMLVTGGVNGDDTSYWAYLGQVNVVTGDKGAGVRYTVQNSGIMSVVFDKLGNYTRDQYSGDISAYRYGIYINGDLVWPVKGGNLTDAPALTARKNANVQALSGVAVAEGDVVDFVCYKNGAWANPWSGCGNVMFPTISIMSGETYSTSFNADTNFPTYTGTGADIDVNWSGNWTIHAYAPNAGYGLEDAANGLILDRESGHGGTWVGNGLSLEDTRGPSWSGRAHLVTNGFNGTYFAEKGHIVTAAGSTAAIRYTAEKTGYAKISINRLANTLKASSGTFTYSVYVNGISLWSTSVTTTNSATVGRITNTGATEALSGIYLVEGDRVEFVIETTAADIWSGCGSIFFGTVGYYHLTEKYAPTGANVNVAVTDSFTANGAGVTVPANVVNPVATGFIVNGKKLGATDALFSMAAKDIATEVTVTPYYTTSYGSVVTGAPVTTSIKALLEGYLSDATYGDAAAAALSYAATAKAYFENTATPVAPTVLPTGSYADQLAVTEKLDDARVVPQQAALLLKDTVSFKFTVKGALAGDQMQITDGTNTAVVSIVDGAAIFDGIGVKNWDTVYTFTVLDAEGNAVSSSFNYSVSTYYARMNANENANLINLVNAMMAFYEAAAAL